MPRTIESYIITHIIYAAKDYSVEERHVNDFVDAA